MWTPSSELEKAAAHLGIALREVPAEECTDWKATLAKRWALHSSDSLWADGEGAGVPTLEPWVWLAHVTGEGPFRVFFPSDNDKRVFEFDSMDNIAKTIGECPRFHFAVTRPGFDFVLTNDYEGGLRGLGLVEAWLEEPPRLLDLPRLPDRLRESANVRAQRRWFRS